jgi:hypothetical protein
VERAIDLNRVRNVLQNFHRCRSRLSCEAANGSTRSSFNTTICVLEALRERRCRWKETGNEPDWPVP